MGNENDEVFGRVSAAVHQTFPDAAAYVVTASTTAADIDGWDSLSYSILIMNVEEAFGIELPLEEVYVLGDIGELCELVATALAAKPTS